MSELKVDLDRPTIIRTLNDYGMDVFMYRDEPGIYLNAHGSVVSEEMAKMAGFDVARYKLMRKRKDAMSAAARAVDAEMLASEKTIREVVVDEKDGYKIVLLSAGRHVVKDPEGNVLTQGVVLTLEMAKKVLDSILADQPKPAEPEAVAKPETAAAVRDRVGRGFGATPLRTG